MSMYVRVFPNALLPSTTASRRIFQVFCYKNDVSRFLCGVHPGFDRDTDIGGPQSAGVIDSISKISNTEIRPFERSKDSLLLIGANLRKYINLKSLQLKCRVGKPSDTAQDSLATTICPPPH